MPSRGVSLCCSACSSQSSRVLEELAAQCMCRRDVCRCRPAAGGNVAAPVPPRAKAQPSGPVSGGLHHLLPSPHLSGQPTHAAPPLLGPSGSLPVLGQVISVAAHVHLPEILRTICWLCWSESCLETDNVPFSFWSLAYAHWVHGLFVSAYIMLAFAKLLCASILLSCGC